MTSVLHWCQNNLLFISWAVDFEIDAWARLRFIADDEKLGPWLRPDADDVDWAAMLDEIDFDLAHTSNWKAHVECLKDRIEIQINLMRLTRCPLWMARLWLCRN